MKTEKQIRERIEFILQKEREEKNIWQQSFLTFYRLGLYDALDEVNIKNKAVENNE